MKNLRNLSIAFAIMCCVGFVFTSISCVKTQHRENTREGEPSQSAIYSESDSSCECDSSDGNPSQSTIRKQIKYIEKEVVKMKEDVFGFSHNTEDLNGDGYDDILTRAQNGGYNSEIVVSLWNPQSRQFYIVFDEVCAYVHIRDRFVIGFSKDGYCYGNYYIYSVDGSLKLLREIYLGMDNEDNDKRYLFYENKETGKNEAIEWDHEEDLDLDSKPIEEWMTRGL